MTAAVIDDESPRAVAARWEGVRVVVGDASERDIRQQLGLSHAGEVFIATSDDG